MIKKIFVYIATVFGLLVVIVALGGTKKLQFAAMGAAGAAFDPPPETVTAQAATEETWENVLTANGSVAPVQGVMVGAEVPGKVVSIHFESGANVAVGDLLVQLDVSTESAQLRAAESVADLAKINLGRARELREKGTNASSDLDAAEAQAKQAAAAADNLRAVIAKKSIRAPFTGRLGIRLVQLGQILRDGESIVTLQTVDPIYTNFALPQQFLASLKVGENVRLTTDASPGETFPGKITAIAPEIDAVTRNIRIQATFANPAAKLRSGMFGSVAVLLPSTGSSLVIPSTAILHAPYGDSVFVITDGKNAKTGAAEKTIRQQFIRVGTARGDFVTVVAGLKPGEWVVTTGIFKLRPGMSVIVDNALAPKAELAPKPANS
ncbi:MAG: efflux RND transporter periplasmic adaptor subunit [Verrucomicrobia bacterium]|nr:efflux RND transporter periplasmic adaptor subunit [Verrucomicrobiota bacterium]